MGASAKQQQIANFKNTISGWKSLVGRKRDDDRVKYEEKFLPYEIVSDESGNTAIKVFGIIRFYHICNNNIVNIINI